MRRLVYHVATTADGFIAREDHSFDDLAMQGDHVADYVRALRSDYGVAVMGRRTYEVGLKLGVTDPYPWLETYVVSRTLKTSPSANVKVIDGEVGDAISRLKASAGKDLYLAGGGVLAGQLLEAGLVDAVVVKVNPVLLGHGIPVAPVRAPVRLGLRCSKVYGSSVVLLEYDVRGP